MGPQTLTLGTARGDHRRVDVRARPRHRQRIPDVDKFTLTGSTATARRMAMDAAASNMKAVSIEAGGKSPHVVFDDVEDWGCLIDTIAPLKLARGSPLNRLATRTS